MNRSTRILWPCCECGTLYYSHIKSYGSARTYMRVCKHSHICQLSIKQNIRFHAHLSATLTAGMSRKNLPRRWKYPPTRSLKIWPTIRLQTSVCCVGELSSLDRLSNWNVCVCMCVCVCVCECVRENFCCCMSLSAPVCSCCVRVVNDSLMHVGCSGRRLAYYRQRAGMCSREK